MRGRFVLAHAVSGGGAVCTNGAAVVEEEEVVVVDRQCDLALHRNDADEADMSVVVVVV
eukprot:EC796179.1.p8 GENE.EC796179.1~~EC796179.1.p8  ORF type:complete len:59 (-),score=29.62 EC796179.1:115-291(-)